ATPPPGHRASRGPTVPSPADPCRSAAPPFCGLGRRFARPASVGHGRYELPPHAVLLEDAAPSGRFNRRTESRSPSFIPDEIPRLGEYPCLISCGGLEEQLKVLGQTSLGELKKRAAER